MVQIHIRTECRAGHRQTGFGNQSDEALHKSCIHQTQALRHMRGHDHAATNRFTMQPNTETQTRFDGVAEGVAEIENGANATFAFILTNHPGFDFATAFDRISQRLRVACQQFVQMLFDPIEKRHVGDRPVLDDLGQTGAEFARRQGLQCA